MGIIGRISELATLLKEKHAFGFLKTAECEV